MSGPSLTSENAVDVADGGVGGVNLAGQTVLYVPYVSRIGPLSGLFVV